MYRHSCKSFLILWIRFPAPYLLSSTLYLILPRMADEVALWDPLLASAVEQQLTDYDQDAPVNRERTRSLLQQIFHDLGGRARLTHHFSQNYKEFVYYYLKHMMPNDRLEVKGELQITIKAAIPPSPLDGEFYDVSNAGSSSNAGANDAHASASTSVGSAASLLPGTDPEGAVVYRFDQAKDASERAKGRRGRGRPRSSTDATDRPPDGRTPRS